MGVKNKEKALYFSQRRYAWRVGLVADLATNNTTSLFRVSGGSILLHGMSGIVSSAMDANATTIGLLLVTAISGTVVPMSAATLAITNAVTEDVITMDGRVGTALTLVTGAARGVGVYNITNEQILVPGLIRMINATAIQVTGGRIDWSISYSPLTEESMVTAI
jgi:hypothetical protein